MGGRFMSHQQGNAVAARLCALRGFFQSYGWWGRGALRCRLKRREFSERADDAAAGWGTVVGL